MTDDTNGDGYGTLSEPATLKFQRLLPGPIERVWAYLTDGEMRRQWLAAGEMQMQAGSAFELVWRNDELTDGERPAGMPEEHRMPSRIVEIDPPRKLVYTWEETGDVSFELEPRGDDVLLTLIHRRVTDRSDLLGTAAGWHAHLDVLAARIADREPKPFWQNWQGLREEYGERFPA